MDFDTSAKVKRCLLIAMWLWNIVPSSLAVLTHPKTMIPERGSQTMSLYILRGATFVGVAWQAGLSTQADDE